MSIRVRGLLITLASALVAAGLFWLLFSSLSPGANPRATRVRVYPFALPVAGVFWGLIELVGGVPFPQLQARWDTMPMRRQKALGCLFAALGTFVLLVLLYLLMIYLGGGWSS